MSLIEITPVTLNIVTIIVAIVSILVNIGIARYNIGKNRKIFEIITINDDSGKNVNKTLNSGDYTILHVSPCNKDIGSKTYVLGKLNSKNKTHNKSL